MREKILMEKNTDDLIDSLYERENNNFTTKTPQQIIRKSAKAKYQIFDEV